MKQTVVSHRLEQFVKIRGTLYYLSSSKATLFGLTERQYTQI